jgi:undecaprenyl-diphosphatase
VTDLQSVVLGAVQGITEFLPISSSAHLIVVPWIFQIDEANVNSLTYDVMLHFGTLCALLVIYGRKLFDVLAEALSGLREGGFWHTLLPKLIVGTVPAAVLGLLFKGFIETQLRTPLVPVFSLVAVSVMMIVAERIHVEGRRMSYVLAILLGCAQALALIPGVSRSGITITVGILLGLKRTEAVEFSFLLSIPIVAGVSLVEMRHLSFSGGSFDVYLAGMLSAFVFGTLSLRFLIGYLRRHSLDVFAIYRIGLAALILFLALQ